MTAIFRLLLYIQITLCVLSAVKHLHFAILKQSLLGLVERKGFVKNTISPTLLGCSRDCFLDDRCLTFFYNSRSGKCIMHSKNFQFQLPNETGQNWQHFVTKDVSGRCPLTYLYYRHLDFCYRIDTVDQVNITEIQMICNSTGGQLAAVDSILKDEYFKHILSDRPHIRVPVAGYKNSNNEWRLEDGSLLTYFNWFPGQGNTSGQNCLMLKTNDQLHDRECVHNFPGTFVCYI